MCSDVARISELLVFPLNHFVFVEKQMYFSHGGLCKCYNFLGVVAVYPICMKGVQRNLEVGAASTMLHCVVFFLILERKERNNQFKNPFRN